jgi:hypothetical protein
MAVHRDVTAAFPVPVAARPDIASPWVRFDFDVLNGRRLRGDHFDIRALFNHDTAFVVGVLVNTAGSACNQCEYSSVTENHAASSVGPASGINDQALL